MNQKELEGIVLRLVLTELAKAGQFFVPVTSSNRHVHLCQADVDSLFGSGYRLTKLRALDQPGQYACQETLLLETEKGSIRLRVVGPIRRETQVELSYTDCFRLGIQPVLRMSGDTPGTPGCILANGTRRVQVPQGVMVAERHLHISPQEALAYGLGDGDTVALQVEGPRALVLKNMVVRTGEGHRLEAHIDKDEANACGLRDGQLCRVLIGKAQEAGISPAPLPPSPQEQTTPQSPFPPGGARATALGYRGEDVNKTKLLDLTQQPHCLIAEEDVLSAHRNGYRLIRYRKDAVINPLARDAASAKNMELIEQS